MGGGTTGSGTVFELKHLKGVWTETVMYRFTGQSDGGYSYFGVILDKTGNLYGATNSGGSSPNWVGLELAP